MSLFIAASVSICGTRPIRIWTINNEKIQFPGSMHSGYIFSILYFVSMPCFPHPLENTFLEQFFYLKIHYSSTIIKQPNIKSSRMRDWYITILGRKNWHQTQKKSSSTKKCSNIFGTKAPSWILTACDITLVKICPHFKIHKNTEISQFILRNSGSRNRFTRFWYSATPTP